MKRIPSWPLVFFAVLAFCTRADTAEGPSVPETVTLYYWGSDFDVFTNNLIQGFESLHDGSDGRPAIKIVMGQTAVVGKDSDGQRLMCSVLGGDPPDVVWIGRNIVAAWAAKGAFTPLNAFLEADLAEQPDDVFTLRQEQFYAHCWDEAHYDGELYAVPADTDVRILFYNLDVFDKHADELIALGCIDPNDPAKPGPPKTWDQLRQCVKLLTRYDEADRLSQVGYIPNYGNTWLCMYAWLNGGEFMSPDGRTCTMNSPQIRDALAYMTELYDLMGGVEKVRVFESSLPGGDMDPFLTGRIAMKIDCDLLVGAIAGVKPNLRFGVALPPAPEGKPSVSWAGGWCWVIPNGTKHPREAWEFAKYLASKQAYKMRMDATRQVARSGGNLFIPIIHARRDLCEWAVEHYVFSDPDLSETYKDALRMVLEALPRARYRPVSPVGQLWWNEHVRAMDAALYHRYAPGDLKRNAQLALDRSTAVIQEELDRIFKPSPYPVLSWKPVIWAYLGLVLLGLLAMTAYFNRKVRARGFFRREFYAGYLFASPWFLGFIIFGGGPILFSLIMSFCEYDVFSPARFVGVKNYADLFTHDPLFYKSLENTVYMALGIPLGMIVSLAIAILLNQEMKGMAVYRTFFYLPAIMPGVAASILWIWILNPQQGILNTLLGQIGVQGPAWLQNAGWSKPALILMGLWGAGGGMIVWLAGLKGIPAHLYEAARLDGAGRLRCFWHITLPMLSPYILFNLIMGLIGTFQLFTQAYIMTQGGPVDSTLFYAYALFNNAFRYLRMGYASAMAWILFAIVLALTLIQLRLSKRWVHYEGGQ